MPVPTPPPRQPALLLVIDRFRIRVPPWVGLVALAVLVPSGAWMALGDSKPPHPSPAPVDGALPLQQWTTGNVPGFASVVLGASIPDKPGPNQKRGKCDPGRSEVEIRGGCWVRTEHPLPCPEGKQWEHEGRCYLPVAHAKPVPTTGEIRPGNVAGEAQ